MANNHAQATAPFSIMDMNFKTKNLNTFYNCNNENVQKFNKNPIGQDMFEMRGAQ